MTKAVTPGSFAQFIILRLQFKGESIKLFKFKLLQRSFIMSSGIGIDR